MVSVGLPCNSQEGAVLGWSQLDSPAISKGGLSGMVSVGLPCNSQEGAFLGRSQIDSPVKVKRGPFWDGFSWTPL
jgi:hypothetical protein